MSERQIQVALGAGIDLRCIAAIGRPFDHDVEQIGVVLKDQVRVAGKALVDVSGADGDSGGEQGSGNGSGDEGVHGWFSSLARTAFGQWYRPMPGLAGERAVGVPVL